MKNAKTKAERPRRVFTAEEKVRAVLALWTEKRSGMEICRELAISWTLMNQWEEQAMSALLSAMAPRRAPSEKGLPNLSERLQNLLSRKAAKTEAIPAEMRPRHKPGRPTKTPGQSAETAPEAS